MRTAITFFIFTLSTILALGPLCEVGAQGEKHLKPVDDPSYKETCGACHFAYQPGLLPSGSWSAILGNLKDHFGEPLDVGDETRDLIAKYLTDNAAENSTSRRSAKIMSSLDGKIPARITEVPYIRNKHRKITSEVFKRQAIGSFSNCPACHTTAEQGIYVDDNVKIPK